MKKLILSLLVIISGLSFSQEIIFEDSFFDNDKKWFEENSSNAKVKIVGKLDQYHIYHKSETGAYTSRMPVDIGE